MKAISARVTYGVNLGATMVDASNSGAKIVRLVGVKRAKAKKGRTDRINLVKEILNKPTKRNFIESLIPIIADFDEAATPLQQLVEEVNKMPATQFPYFLTLIKFEYAIEKKNRKGGE